MKKKMTLMSQFAPGLQLATLPAETMQHLMDLKLLWRQWDFLLTVEEQLVGLEFRQAFQQPHHRHLPLLQVLG